MCVFRYAVFGRAVAVLLVGLACACGPLPEPVDAGPMRDAGTVDAVAVDAGSFDGGTVDGGTFDGGTFDAGVLDAGNVDAGTFDAGTFDAGTFDAGTFDAGTFDAGTFDAGTFDAGAFDAGAFDAGAVCAAGGALELVFPGPDQCPLSPSDGGVFRYVAPTGADQLTAGSTAGAPLRTVGYALGLARPGDVIVVADGVYREGIESNAGGLPGAPITLRAAPGARPVLSGSVEVSSWSAVRGAIWSTPWSATQLFPEGCSGGECPTLARGAPQQVFVDGVPLQQIAGVVSAVHPSCPSVGVDWCREVVGTGLTDLDTRSGAFFFDAPTNTLFVRLPGDAPPAGRRIEVSLQRRVLFFYPGSSGNVCVEGFTFRHSNASATLRQMAGVTLLGGSLLSNSIVEDMDLTGVGTAGTVSQSIIRNNGQMGLNGNSTARIERSQVSGNNRRHFNPFWEAGGMKLVTGGVRVEGNHVFDNDGPGIWLDGANGSATTPSSVARNWVHGNGREGQVMIEISSHVRVTHNVVWNDGRTGDENVRGIYVSESPDVLVAFNTVVSTAPTFEFDALSGARGTIERLDVRSNLFAAFGTVAPSHSNIRVSPPTAWTSNYNAFFGARRFELQYGGQTQLSLSAWQTASGQDANSLGVDPQLLNVPGLDFRPAATSPLRGAGSAPSGVGLDFSGRPRKPVPQIGAFESCP